MPNIKFPYFEDTPYILDNVSTTVDQRPAQDADFTDGEDYDGYTWDALDDASVRQQTKNKYVARRKVMTASMFKKASGVNFFYKMIADELTIGKVQPPDASLPFDEDTLFGSEQPFKSDWLMQQVTAQYTKDGNIQINATYKKTYPWELLLLNESEQGK